VSLRWFIFSAEEVKRKFIAEPGNSGIIKGHSRADKARTAKGSGNI
jgi:hypothetical protein